MVNIFLHWLWRNGIASDNFWHSLDFYRSFSRCVRFLLINTLVKPRAAVIPVENFRSRALYLFTIKNIV